MKFISDTMFCLPNTPFLCSENQKIRVSRILLRLQASSSAITFRTIMKAAVINYGRHSAAGLLNNNAVDMFGRPENAKLDEGDNSYIRVNVVCRVLSGAISYPRRSGILLRAKRFEPDPSRRIGEDWEVAAVCLLGFIESYLHYRCDDYN